MICKQCGKEFEAKRSDAQYCSKSCRAVSAKRNQPDGKISATDADGVALNAIDWDDPDVHMSDICRRTQGRVTLPGDPGYEGVCEQGPDGHWRVKPEHAGRRVT